MTIQQQLQQIINHKTKPTGALGLLENVAEKIGVIQNTVSPVIANPHIVVFAADHGIAATGLVNPFPQSVTTQMVLNFINGGAAINVFTRLHNIGLVVVDAGVNCDFDENLFNKNFINAKINYGTNNYLQQNAMALEEALQAMEKGRAIIKQIVAQNCNCVGFGEMGIGNTSSAALISSAIMNMPIRECVGNGTGVNKKQLSVKMNTLEMVFQHYNLPLLSNKPLELLCAIGGFEIAMMAGAYLQAAAEKMVIIVDGFIATAALLIAYKTAPAVLNYCVFAHVSNEQAHAKIVNYLQAQPLLNIGMRLGEGTGAALAIPLVRSAVAFLNEMASFDTAGISNKVS